MNNNKLDQIKELELRHKQVLNHIADGLPRYKAWQKVHVNCNTDDAARRCVRALLKKPEAQLYLSEQLQERACYVDSQNRITPDGIAREYKQTIEHMTYLARELQNDSPQFAIQAHNTKLKAIKEYSQFMSVGGHAKIDTNNNPKQLDNINNKQLNSDSNNKDSQSKSDITQANESNIESFIDIIATPVKSDA